MANVLHTSVMNPSSDYIRPNLFILTLFYIIRCSYAHTLFSLTVSFWILLEIEIFLLKNEFEFDSFLQCIPTFIPRSHLFREIDLHWIVQPLLHCWLIWNIEWYQSNECFSIEFKIRITWICIKCILHNKMWFTFRRNDLHSSNHDQLTQINSSFASLLVFRIRAILAAIEPFHICRWK